MTVRLGVLLCTEYYYQYPCSSYGANNMGKVCRFYGSSEQKDNQVILAENK